MVWKYDDVDFRIYDNGSGSKRDWNIDLCFVGKEVAVVLLCLGTAFTVHVQGKRKDKTGIGAVAAWGRGGVAYPMYNIQADVLRHEQEVPNFEADLERQLVEGEECFQWCRGASNEVKG